MKEWRNDFKSSIIELDLDFFLFHQEKKILNYIDSIHCKKKKNLALLCLPGITHKFNGILISAIALQEGDKLDIKYVSTIPEVLFLQSGERVFGDNKATSSPKFLFFRRIARTISWTKWYQLLSVFFNPDVVAVSHNGVLRRYVHLTNKKVYFLQAAELFRRVNLSYIKRPVEKYVPDISNDIYRILLNGYTLSNSYKSRFDKLTLDLIKEALISGFHDLESCYSYSKLPKNIWIGTGGDYLSRLFALSSVYKGGESIAFSHSTTPVFSRTKINSLINELAVTSSYVCASKRAKELVGQMLTKSIRPSLLYVDGDPLFYNRKEKKRNGNSKPCVMYASGAIRDLNLGSALLNSMTYLEWQLRLTDLLDSMKIDLMVQPHPEGIFKDLTLTHPLLDKYNQKKRKFENIIGKSDVFLIDSINSSVAGMMLLTNKPVVLIDFGGMMNSYKERLNVKDIIDKRCRVVTVQYNSLNNLPYIDHVQLNKALTCNWKELVDPLDIRKVFLDGC